MKSTDMDKLTELEKESQELLSDFKSMINDENNEWKLAPLDITEQKQQKLFRRRIPSWVAVAAMITGIAIGFAMPHYKTPFDIFASTKKNLEGNKDIKNIPNVEEVVENLSKKGKNTRKKGVSSNGLDLEKWGG